MRNIRLYCSQRLHSSATIELDTKATKHAVQVLRLKTGDSITLFNGDGMDYPALLKIAGKSACATISAVNLNTSESELPIKLVQGISRSEKMDFTLQKSTELGVNQIQPVFCLRSIVTLKGPRLSKKIEHWTSVIQSACEQSGRSKLPVLLQPMTIEQFFTILPTEFKIRIMLDPMANCSFSSLSPGSDGCELLIGPEGGFDESEIQAARSAGFSPLSLGPRILRTETAGLASIAILQSLYGDLN